MHGFLCVKSIVTVILVLTLAYLAITHPEEYKETIINITYIIVTFYFSYQNNKKKEGETSERNDNTKRG